MEGTLTPTYSLNGGNDMFGGSGIRLFAILALMRGGNGFFGGKNGANAATQDDLNFSRLENQVRANADLTERKNDQIINGISTLGYEIADKFAQTNANTTAQIQSVKDQIAQDKIASLQQKVTQLETQAMLSGVVRYPMATTYSVPSPCFSGCGCQGI